MIYFKLVAVPTYLNIDQPIVNIKFIYGTSFLVRRSQKESIFNGHSLHDKELTVSVKIFIGLLYNGHYSL